MSRYFSRPDLYFATAARPRIAVTHQPIPAPAFLRGVKALFVSDIHLLPGMDADAIAERIAGCRADLILFGGDFADDRRQALRLFSAFRALRAPLGLFSVRGNNDAEAFESVEALSDALSNAGVRLLVNTSEILPLAGGTLAVCGVDEYRYNRPDCAAALTCNADYRILLSHYPILPDAGPAPDLMLSGHTHGGQFNCLSVTPYAVGFERRVHNKRLAPVRVSGMEVRGATTLLVSKGVGTSRIPLRIGVRPEITLIEFSC